MVVLFNTEGRFGHQLSQYVTLLAYSKQYGKAFCHWRFQSRFGNFFCSRQKNRNEINISFRIVFYFLMYKLLKLFAVKKLKFSHVEFYLSAHKKQELVFDDTIQQLFLSNAKYVISDYVFNDVQILIKYKQYVQQQLLPNIEIEKKVTGITQLMHSKYKILVGLHIRRTDFKYFENGRFYYNDEVYLMAITHFINAINTPNKEIAFVLCSDEDIDVSKYASYNIFFERRTTAEDFFLLAKCDYIIATRSIFSTMANYFCNNKIYQITEVDKVFSLDDFMRSEDLLASKYNLKEKQDVN